MTPKTFLLIALAAAFLAIALSGLGRGGRGFRPFLADLRFWVRQRPDSTGIGAVAETRPLLIAVPAVEEGGIDDLFDIGTRPEHSYLEPLLWLTQWSASPRADTPLAPSPAADKTPPTFSPAGDTPLTASPAMVTAA